MKIIDKTKQLYHKSKLNTKIKNTKEKIKNTKEQIEMMKQVHKLITGDINELGNFANSSDLDKLIEKLLKDFDIKYEDYIFEYNTNQQTNQNNTYNHFYEKTDEETLNKYLKSFGLTKETLTEQNLKKNFRTLCKRYHPDNNTNSNAKVQFEEVQKRYDYLKKYIIKKDLN